jgi:hypothetical protein
MKSSGVEDSRFACDGVLDCNRFCPRGETPDLEGGDVYPARLLHEASPGSAFKYLGWEDA